MEKENEKKQIDGEIYKSLEGYFPERYDLSPEELDKQIDVEKKQSEAVLGFIGTDKKDGPEKEPPVAETTVEPRPMPVEIEEAEPIIEEIAEPEEEESSEGGFAYVTVEEIRAFDGETEPYEETAEEVSAPVAEETFEEEIIVPEAKSVENNPLIGDMDPLDALFNDMNRDDEVIKKIGSVDEGDNFVETKGHKTVNWFFDFLEIFAVCLTAIILVFAFCVRLTRVDGASMNDTLVDGEYLLVTDLFYTPTVGDIVVLQDTSNSWDALTKPLVKRLIATEGQTVDIEPDGSVTITEPDGTSYELDQSFIKKEPYQYSVSASHFVVPEGCVFVMGDNRNGSTDSRYQVGYVDERCIFGKAICRIFPFNTFTFFQNPYNN